MPDHRRSPLSPPGYETVPSSAVPSSWPPPSSEPRLTLAQYASLRAEVVSAPADGVRATRARYGLDEAGDLAEAEAWGRKFAGQPALFEQYKSLFQYLRSLARRLA